MGQQFLSTGRGRYQVMVRGASAPHVATSPEWAHTLGRNESLALPSVRSVTNKGLKFSSGGETFAGLRDGGRDAVPVAMTEKQMRLAAQQGWLAGPAHQAKGKGRMSTRAGQISISIDLTEMRRLAGQIDGIGNQIRVGHGVIAKSINEGLRKLEVGLKRDLVGWTGLKNKARLSEGFRKSYASSQRLSGRLRVTDTHLTIRPDQFGARWSQSNPGGTHTAWGRPQLARHSFIAKVKNGTFLFIREGRDRKKLKALWGPNVVREITRHEAEVSARLTAVTLGVQQTAVRLIKVAIAQAGGR